MRSTAKLNCLPLVFLIRLEVDLNFITITITKAMITRTRTMAISSARMGLKLSCHTFPARDEKKARWSAEQEVIE